MRPFMSFLYFIATSISLASLFTLFNECFKSNFDETRCPDLSVPITLINIC